MISKLPNTGTTIFTVMSLLAEQHQAINLAQGFPNFDCPEPLKKLFQHYIQAGFNQYAPMPGVPVLRKHLAEKIERLYDRAVNPDSEITITAGGTQAIFTAITAFVSAGDEVILVEPCYDSYAPSVILCGGIVVPYALTAPDYNIDWEAVRLLMTSRTRMIIINTPHNPTGKILREADMKTLQEITDGTDILVISDEVYEHLIFDGQQHESVLRYPALYNRSLAIYSFGKTFHATGWKTGYCVAPEHLTREFRKVHQFNVFSSNTPIQYAIADYLDQERFYETLPDFYSQKRDMFLEKMKGSRFIPLACEGTYFQLYDYSAVSDLPDTEFVKLLTKDWGVAAIPVSVFYSGGSPAHIIRFCFAKTEETLVRAAELLCKV